MVEIAIGATIVAAALALALAASGALILPAGGLLVLVGPTGWGALGLAGLLLVLHGAYRVLRRRRSQNLYALKSAALAWTMAIAALLICLAIPPVAVSLDIVKVAGFPLGFYLVAQGALIGLTMIAFIAVARQDAIDREAGAPD